LWPPPVEADKIKVFIMCSFCMLYGGIFVNIIILYFVLIFNMLCVNNLHIKSEITMKIVIYFLFLFPKKIIQN